MSDTPLSVVDLVGTLRDRARTPLHDPSLGPALFTRPLEEAVSLPTDAVTFVISGEASVHLYTTASEAASDEDALFTTPDADDADADSLGPQIPYRDGAAWLKYRTHATAKLSVATEGDLPHGATFGVSTDAEHRLTFADYRLHASDETLLDALRADLASARFVVLSDHVRRLKPGEALTVQSDGALSLNVNVAWSDVAMSAITALTRLSDRLNVARVSVAADARIAVDVSIEDAFLLAFTRPEDGRLRLAIQKSSTRSVGASLGGRVSVSLADPDAVTDLVDDVLEGFVDASMEEVQALLDAESADDLSDSETTLLNAVLDQLGVEGGDDPLARLRSTLDGLRTDATAAVQSAAETTVKLGFSYEYARVRSATALVQATFADDVLDAVHGPALTGNLRPLLDRATGDAPSVALERFARQQTTTVSKAWGFGLSLGDWFSLQGKDFERTTWTETQSAPDRVTVAFTGVRGYRKRWNDDALTWMAELSADGQEPRSPHQTTANAFDYGLKVILEYGADDDLRSLIPRWIDQACLWDILPADEREAERDRLETMLDDATDVTALFHVTVSGNAFLDVIGAMAQDDGRYFAQALGEAMPWTTRHASIRQNPSARRRLYAPLWKAYLDGQLRGMSESKIGDWASGVIEGNDEPELAADERRDATGSFRSQMSMNPKTRRQWEDMTRGARRLRDAVYQRRSHRDIEDAFHDLSATWTQSHHVRALGVYLLDLAATFPGGAALVDHALTLTYTVDGTESVYVVSASDAGNNAM